MVTVHHGKDVFARTWCQHIGNGIGWWCGQIMHGCMQHAISACMWVCICGSTIPQSGSEGLDHPSLNWDCTVPAKGSTISTIQYNSEIRIVNTTLSVHWTLETPGPVMVIVDKNCTGVYVFGLSIWVHWFLCVSAFIFTLHIWLQLVPSNGSNFAHVDVLLLLIVDPCEVNCHCGWVINALQLLDLPWPWDSLCSFASLRESIACKRSVVPE